MTPQDALAVASRSGVSVRLDGDDLVLEAGHAPPCTVLDTLAYHKQGIIVLLRGAAAGEQLRRWYRGVALVFGSIPVGTNATEWRATAAAAAAFLEVWGAQAAALGWDTLSLFAVHAQAPFVRLDHIGLVCLMNRRRVIALTESTATIHTESGARQTYRRRPPAKPGWIPLWELLGP